MARGLNKVMLIGNLGSDPEIKYAPSGTAIANFNLATSENRRNKNGEWQEATEWHKIVMFAKQAELCKDYLKKGSKVYIEGRLQTRSWEDKNGQKRYLTEVVGLNLVMLDQKGTIPAKGREEVVPDAVPETPLDEFPEGEDDLPF